MIKNLFKFNPYGFRPSFLFSLKPSFSTQMVSHRPTPDNSESVPFDFTKENYVLIDKILSKYPKNYKRSGVIPLLTVAQKQNNNFLSLSAMKKIAKILEISEMDVFEVASFYSMFNREKIGKFHLQICGTTPCQLCGSREVIKACEKHLGIKNNESTPDGLFTIQEVECLGACVNAPMLQINGEWVYEDLNPTNVVELLEKLKKGEKVKLGPQNHRKNSEGPLGRTSLKTNASGEAKFERDFAKAKKEWAEKKEKERIEAEKKKAAAAAAAAAAQKK